MNLLIVFIFILFFIIGISILINYFTSIFLSDSLNENHIISFLISTLLLSYSILSLPIKLNIDFNYYILPILILGHFICYNYSYLFLIFLSNILYFIETKILKSKIIIKIFSYFHINFDYIFHPCLNFSKQPIHENLKLLKILLFISYFLSIVAFKFFFEPYLIATYEINDFIINSLNTYTDIFIVSIIPVFISFFKNIRI